MTVKTFFYGLIASFGLPWLILLAVPFGTMRSMEAPRYDEVNDESTDYYTPKHSGRMENGSLVYAQEGCAMCHSQVTRPTYAGMDVFREGQGGTKEDPERGDTRRITNAWDFGGEKRAHIGESRIGTDLGNYGNRMDILQRVKNAEMAESLGIKLTREDKTKLTESEIIAELGDKAFNKELHVYKHLYNPRSGLGEHASVCQANPQFFEECGNYGQGACDAVAFKDGQQVVPNSEGRAIVSYLLNLKRDGAVPYAMQYSKDKKKAGK